jgi:hypothetical protein
MERDLVGPSSADKKKVEGPDQIKSNNTSFTPEFLHNIMHPVNLHKRVDSLISAITITKTRPKQRAENQPSTTPHPAHDIHGQTTTAS